MEISKICFDQAKGLEDYCGFLPIRKGTKAPLVSYKNEPHLSLAQALRFNPAALAVRSKNLLCLDYDSEEALIFAATRGIDFTGRTWHICRSDNEERFKTVYYVTNEKLLELPNQEIKRTVNYQNSNLDVFLTNKGYILFTGEHPSGGNYFSYENYDISELAPPPKEVWNLVLEIASSEQISPKKTYPSTTSTRLNPCPICGRHERLWCSKSQDGLIFCMNGSTFSAEKAHGPLKIGQVVTGGYAVVAMGDICTTFKVHQPRNLHRPHRSKTNARRMLNARK